MSTANRVIMVVDESVDRSRNLKSLIEFMDAPAVRTADPANWHTSLENDHLAALFISRDLPDDSIRSLLEDIGRIDPNVPIVLIDRQHNA